MVQYQVLLSVRYEIYAEYIQWLQDEHIHEVLSSPGFFKAELLYDKTGTAVESSSREIQVHYYVESEELLKKYISERALILREKGMNKFPGQFSAHRAVWKQVISIPFTS